MMDYFSALLLERESRDLLDAKKVLERESAEADDRMKAIDREINAFTLKSGNRSTGGPPTGVTAEDKLEEAILLLRGQLNEVRLIIEKATAQAHATEAADAPPIDKYSSGASLSSLHRQESLLSMRLENSRNLLRELRSQPDERIRVQRMIDDLYKRKEFEYHVYSDLRKEAMNIDIQRSTAHNKLKILDRPSINNVRTGETLKPLLIKRCFMAAVFAIILVFFRDLFNPLIRSRKELDDLGLYYVGSVPDMSRKRRFNLVRTLKESLRWLGHRGKHGKHHTAMNTYFEMVFKNIAARILNYHDGARPAPKVVSVMSSVSAEGKTTIAESLARVLAKSGKRTLLVDADLRRRTLTRRLGYIDAPGIADFLQHRNEKFSEPVVKSIDKNFEFMPSGASVVDAMELISSVNYNDFIEAMRHYYEVVVIDTPPCIPCSEVIPLANTSDMVVLSVNLESTLLSNVEDTIEKLNLRNEIPLAYVMNMDQKVETLTYYSDYFIVPQSRTAKPAV
jgi:Mrp family chromosome partitioning ATPase